MKAGTWPLSSTPLGDQLGTYIFNTCGTWRPQAARTSPRSAPKYIPDKKMKVTITRGWPIFLPLFFLLWISQLKKPHPGKKKNAQTGTVGLTVDWNGFRRGFRKVPGTGPEGPQATEREERRERDQRWIIVLIRSYCVCMYVGSRMPFSNGFSLLVSSINGHRNVPGVGHTWRSCVGTFPPGFVCVCVCVRRDNWNGWNHNFPEGGEATFVGKEGTKKGKHCYGFSEKLDSCGRILWLLEEYFIRMEVI